MRERTLILKVPQTCEKCKYKQRIEIDHNYYGEKSYQDMCGVFGVRLYKNEPCNACKEEAIKLKYDASCD